MRKPELLVPASSLEAICITLSQRSIPPLQLHGALSGGRSENLLRSIFITSFV